MPRIFIGTSGWLYDWNLDGSLDWYVKYSNLNAVELNASFYRFPFRNQVISWSRKSKNLRWVIKVHRSITHYRKLSKESYSIWLKFYNLFSPLDPYIDFYLFQLPPSYVKNDRNIEKLKLFSRKTGLKQRFAVEFRHKSWFNNETIKFCKDLGVTVVSIDSPLGTWITKSNSAVYLRIHGRETWYAYDYEYNELFEVAKKIADLAPERIYVFFNNNHWMLKNAKIMKEIFKSIFQS